MKSTSRRDFLKAGAAVGAYVAASSALTKGLYAAGATAPNYGPKTLPWAVQLYTVGGPWRTDPAGTLAHVASIGFKGVEFAGYPPGVDAKGLRKMLDDNGLKAVGSHVGLNTMQGDMLKGTVEFAQIVGLPQLGISNTTPAALNGGGRGGGAPAPALIPGLTAEQVTAVGMTDSLAKATQAVTDARNALNAATFAPMKDNAAIAARANDLGAAELALADAKADTLGKIQSSPGKLTSDQVQALINGGRGAPRGGRGGGAQISTATKAEWEAVADAFSEVGRNLKPFGLRTYYHCHPQDFATINGETTWDIFFNRADKQQVFMQIDLGHMGTAGVDQVAEMKKFPSRAKTVHVKPTNGGGGKLVGDPGDTNNWPAIFAACEDPKVGGTEWYILEYDGGSMPQVDATMVRMKEWGKV